MICLGLHQVAVNSSFVRGRFSTSQYRTIGHNLLFFLAVAMDQDGGGGGGGLMN